MTFGGDDGTVVRAAGDRRLALAVMIDRRPVGRHPAQLEQVADETNKRPRKTFGWAKPADLLAGGTEAGSA